MPYSEDLRSSVVEGYQAGEGSIRVLAARYKLSKNTVVSWLKRHEETGELKPRKAKKRRPRTLEAIDKAVAWALTKITDQDAKGWFNACGYLCQ